MSKINKEILNAVTQASRTYSVPVDIILSVIEQESGFNPKALSKAGAKGLMQLMPATAAGLGVANPYNIHQNVMGGTKYLSQLLKRFKGDIKKALAGYNAGPNAVAKYNGIPPYKETQQYVKNITSRIDSGKYNGITGGASSIPVTDISNQSTGAAANLPTDAITVDVPQAAIMGNPYQYTPDEYRAAATSATNLQNLYNFANQLRPTSENLTDTQLDMLQGSVTPTNPQAYVDMQNAQNQAILQMQQQLAERDRLSQEDLARRFSELEQLYNQDPRLTNKGYYVDPNAIATNTVASQAYTNITGRPSTDLQTPEQLAQRLYQAQVANQYGIPYEQYIVAEQRRLENIANVKAAQIEYAVQQLRQQGINDREIAKMLNNSSFVQEYQKDVQNVRDNAQKNFNTLMQYDPSFQSAMVNQAGGIIQQGQQVNQQAMQGAAGYQEALDKQREANIPNLYNTSANLAVGTQGNLLNYDVNKQKAETEAQLAPAKGYNYVTTGISNMKFADPTSSVPNLVGNMPSSAQQYIIPQGATPEEINKAYGTQVQAPPTSSEGLLQRAVEYGRRFITPLQ